MMFLYYSLASLGTFFNFIFFIFYFILLATYI